MTALPRLLSGTTTGEHLLVEPTRWEFPDAADYWDANWIYATITARAGAFRGSFEALLRTDEFLSFRDKLRPLYDSLRGEAAFDCLEHWLTVKIIGDGKGHFTSECEVRDEPGMWNKLLFTLAFDQTELPAILRDLDELVRVFPVRGSR